MNDNREEAPRKIDAARAISQELAGLYNRFTTRKEVQRRMTVGQGIAMIIERVR